MDQHAEYLEFPRVDSTIGKVVPLLGVVVWLIGCLFYTIQYFLRVSVAGLTHNISVAFHQDATALSIVAAAYYYTYMLLQVPSGTMIDRFGCRKMLVFSTLLSGFSCILFSVSHNFTELVIARLLMGAGGAFSILITMKLIRQWFLPSYFPMLSSLTMALGILGGSLGAGPLVVVAHHMMWQNILFYSGCFCLLLALVSYYFLKFDVVAPEASAVSSQARERESGVSLFCSQLKAVCRLPMIWYSGILTGMLYVPMTAFASLWCVPFLKAVYPTQTYLAIGLADVLLFIGYAVGSLLLSYFSAKNDKPFIVIRACCLAIILLVSIMIGLPPKDFNMMMGILFFIGFASGGLVIVWNLVRKATALSMSATAFGLLNFLQILGGALVLPIMGFELDSHWGHHVSPLGERIFSIGTYHDAFSIMVLCGVVALIVSFKLSREYHSAVENRH